MELIDEKKSYIQRIRNSKELAARDGRFALSMLSDIKSIINNKELSLDNLIYFCKLCEDWDKKCQIPLGLGMYLDEASHDSSVVIGLRRIKINDYTEEIDGVPYSKTLCDIMNDGVVNHIHTTAIGGVGIQDFPSLDLVFTPLKGIAGFINLIGSYNGNNTTLLAKFPSSLVDDEFEIRDKENLDKIYDISDGHYVVKSAFLTTVIIKNDKGLDKVVSKKKIISLKQMQR